MSPDQGGDADVVVVGGGLAGALLALELAGRGLATELIDAGSPDPGSPDGGAFASATACATALSYGAMAPWAAPFTPMGWLIRGGPGRWRQLQRRHGPLGWQRAWFRPVGEGAPLGGLLPLPCSRVQARLLVSRWPAVLRAAGVRLSTGRVTALEPDSEGQGGWLLRLQQGASRRVPQLVLAAGAGCRPLWPALPQRLRVSWAGVLELDPRPGPGPAGGGLRLPARFSRLTLEARAAELGQEAWTVDPGLLSWDDGWLAGQISLLRPGLEPGEPPDVDLQERRLRQALSAIDADLASWPGRFRQVPVSFCPGGLPLVGPVAPPGLWLFSGFSGAFAQVPVLAPLLADWIAASGGPTRDAQPSASDASRRLHHLGVLPDRVLPSEQLS
ncbi:FAD-binding oxidoreductase [Cyanobium sp. ATX 6A2]|uniref:FAD-dependent oxidoreductase n=1 Tax=Cyanobium sp. ATX 6A2 TaxID=2823700 RepID=UPI0020CD91DF|nr:FAD-dependent oxidoreductase [Cyanobium sp. ATX 6A2]MCP9886444.1 FAD-binding oxidoreductase [Cyanobium sp. ATX 6A2]